MAKNRKNRKKLVAQKPDSYTQALAVYHALPPMVQKIFAFAVLGAIALIVGGILFTWAKLL